MIFVLLYQIITKHITKHTCGECLPSADHLAILGGIHAEVKPIFVFKNERQGDEMGEKNK